MNNYDTKIGIKSWAEEDRPREKLSGQGRRALTDAELIAILIGSGSRDETAVELSKRILHHYGNDLNKLGKASIAELSNFKGIGEAKAISIIAALEIGRRRSETESASPEHIGSSRDTYNIMKRHFIDLNHEEFWIVLTSRSSKLIAKELVSKGGLAATVVDPKIIFGLALQHKATNVFLLHNHPSGNLKPSHEDIHLTKKLVEAGRLLDIKVLDHLIVTDKGFYSMADEGLF
ncbi:DNA repair protein RadC [Mucilaginibacter sp. BJC16-A38]|uniref:RadC family protein n=1 Tax=Mucilaginibacter phenanthrenivorans TaxID=1234842 RepID=UPI002157F986|nr:DNA repair protein RadC [Mucilaginibacter phenanthrenivorans]MCR8559686.1 DNA repair protein RadC [Mucilaginibacter phenanthrenivorans]